MKKKILTLLALTFASITPLVACQKNEDNSKSTTSSTQTQPASSDQTDSHTSVKSVNIKNEGRVLNLSLDNGETSSGKIECEVLPSTVDQGVTYISNDESIATVNQNGQVFAHWKGTTTITVTSTLDTTKSDTITINVSDTRDSITRWSNLLQGSFQLKGVVEETDTLVTPSADSDTDTLVTPSADSDMDADAETYVIDRIEKRYSEGKKYNYDLDISNVDFEAGETEADGLITEERLSVFNKDEDPQYAGYDGSVQDTSLNQDNTIQRSFITYDWDKECANPFAKFTAQDYKYTDESKTSFTIADSHSEVFDDICTNLVFPMQDDPYTSLVFTEGNDKTLNAVIKDSVEEVTDDDGGKWNCQITATYTITAKDEEAFNVEPREETDLSRKFDSVLDNMKNLESYTISHTDTYPDSVTPPTDTPENYDVKILQHVNEETIDYTIANYGTKKGVAKFKDNSYYQYSWDKDTDDETKNVITKGDAIANPESYRAQYVPKYDSISGTMFKDNKDGEGSYSVDETNLYGINHHVRMFIFYYLLLEDYDSKMYTDYEPENLKIYLDETDSSKPVLKALSYDQMNKEDNTLVKHTKYEYKDLNSTTITDLDFNI